MAMEIKEIRKNNMLMLVQKSGLSARDFAKTYGIDEAYISQIRRDVRAMGSAFARKIEEKYGLEKGWFDIPRTQQNATVTSLTLEVADNSG